ncbi:MAG: hypothetical protein ABJA87_11470 [bacterium]
MTETRAQLLERLAHEMATAGDSVPGSWDKFSVVAEITALGVRVTGFRYDGDVPGRAMLMDAEVIDTIADLRTASPGPSGELFDVYVARLDRDEGSIVDQAFSAATGSGYRVTAANVARIAGLVRPGSPFLPATAQAPVPPAEESNGPEADPEGWHKERDPWRGAVTRDVLEWPADGPDDWTSFGGAAAFSDAVPSAVGFRYRRIGDEDEAEPVIVGGDFLAHLQSWRAAAANEERGLAGAILLRLPSRTEPVQAHFVHGPTADQIRWDAADAVLAGRLRPAGPTGPVRIRPRPDPDRLDVTFLLDRVRADVAASLRGVGGWRRAGLAVDCAGGRSVGMVWDEAGQSRQWRPLLPPEDDLAELRAQTVRLDGAQWAGARIRAWAGTDRVDVTFFGPEGMAALIGSSPEQAEAALAPPPTPPAEPPSVPWPAQGGRLDADALLADVAAALLSSPDLATDDWQRVAFVLVFDGPDGAPAVTATALRYRFDGAAVVTAVPATGPVGKLRRATGGWPVCVLQGRRGSSSLMPYYLSGRDADRFRLDADTIAGAADQLRPV